MKDYSSENSFTVNSGPFQTRTIFVGDLSYFCNERHLRELFEPYGELETVQIKSNSAGRRHLAYGFVRFLKSEAAETAIREKNGFILLGRAIRVGWASDNPDKKLPQDKKCADRVKEDPTAQLHVGFVAKDFRFAVTEATLRKLYSQFGDLIDVTIKKNKFSKQRGTQIGYGFIHYPLTLAGIDSARTAIQCTNNITIDSVTYQCSFSNGLKDYMVSVFNVSPTMFMDTNTPFQVPPPIITSLPHHPHPAMYTSSTPMMPTVSVTPLPSMYSAPVHNMTNGMHHPSMYGQQMIPVSLPSPTSYPQLNYSPHTYVVPNTVFTFPSQQAHSISRNNSGMSRGSHSNSPQFDYNQYPPSL